MTNCSGTSSNRRGTTGPKNKAMDSPSSFLRYPEYKDTEIPWLGKLPINWRIGRLKHLLRIRGGQDHKAVESEDPTDIPVIGSGGPFTYANDYLYKGESVLLGRKGTIDKPLYVNGKFWTVDTMFYTEVQKGSNGRYAYYLATTIPFSLYSTNTALPSMSQFDLANHVFPIPLKNEQTQIARFLDHETAKIDALIREQERLIALLQEKRQAVISHAVTKGLDPNVPMKDSGVEWLGEVPEHWIVGKLRWYATIQGGIAKGKDYEDKVTVNLPYLRVANVQAGYVDLTEVKEISVLESEINRYSLQVGDVLMNEGGDNDKLGRGTVWAGEIEPCLHQNHVFAIRPNRHLNPEWLSIFTQSSRARSYFFLNSKQSTNLASISSSNVMNMDLPLPPLDEQRKILELLVNDLKRLAKLQKQSEVGIQLLNERRSALISAAVTGKIDVRNWQPPTDESAYPEDVRQAGLEAEA